MEVKKRISIILCILFVLNSFIITLNISSKDIIKEEYIQKQINNNVSIIDIIYSKKFDKNKSIIKIRDNINSIYDIANFLNIDTSKMDTILESNIFKTTFTKISMNIINSIKDDKYYKLVNEDDYDSIIEENIDDLLNKIDIKLLKSFREPIVKLLRKIGSDVIEEIPTTEKVFKKMPNYKKKFINIILNDNLKNIMITINILILAVLIYLNRNYKLLLNLSYVIISIILLLFISNIYLVVYSNKYINEWIFVNNIIKHSNYNIIFYEMLLIFIMSILLSIYEIIKKSIKN